MTIRIPKNPKLILAAAMLVQLLVPAVANADCDHESDGWWRRHCHRDDWGRHHRQLQSEATRDSKKYGENTTQFTNGQRNGFSNNSGNLSSLAGAMESYAQKYEAKSREYAEAQKALVTTSTTRTPGPSVPDTQEFAQRTNNGESVTSNYNSASNRTVKEQATAYDDIGKLRQAADDEAKKYREKAAEMKQLASKNDQNANKLDNSKEGAGGGGGAPPGGDQKGEGSPSTIASKPNEDLSKPPVAPTDKLSDPTNKNATNLGDGTKQPGGEKPLNLDGNRKPASSTSGVPGSPNFGISNSANDLRDSINKKLNSGGASARSGSVSGSGGGGASSGGSDSAGAPETPTKMGADPASSYKVAGGGNSGGGGSSGSSDEVLSPFGKPLSDPKFSLPGSETEASVNGIIGEFKKGEEASGDIASDIEDGIGGKNSQSLFERAHARHMNCAEKQCVRTGKGNG